MICKNDAPSFPFSAYWRRMVNIKIYAAPQMENNWHRREYNHIMKSLILKLELHRRIREGLCEPREEFIFPHRPLTLWYLLLWTSFKCTLTPGVFLIDAFTLCDCISVLIICVEVPYFWWLAQVENKSIHVNTYMNRLWSSKGFKGETEALGNELVIFTCQDWEESGRKRGAGSFFLHF